MIREFWQRLCLVGGNFLGDYEKLVELELIGWWNRDQAVDLLDDWPRILFRDVPRSGGGLCCRAVTVRYEGRAVWSIHLKSAV